MLSVKWWQFFLTYWGRVTYICVSKRTTIGSNNGLSPGRRQAIIWPNAGILLIQTLGTNFSEILREIYTFSFKEMHLKMSSGKCRPSCLGLKVLMWPSDTYVRRYNGSSLVQIMACRLFGPQAFLRTNAVLLLIGPFAINSSDIKIKLCYFMQEHSLKNIVSNTAAI